MCVLKGVSQMAPFFGATASATAFSPHVRHGRVGRPGSRPSLLRVGGYVRLPIPMCFASGGGIIESNDGSTSLAFVTVATANLPFRRSKMKEELAPSLSHCFSSLRWH
jgi:hypothetical protein